VLRRVEAYEPTVSADEGEDLKAPSARLRSREWDGSDREAVIPFVSAAYRAARIDPRLVELHDQPSYTVSRFGRLVSHAPGLYSKGNSAPRKWRRALDRRRPT
jgi:hypothetical protein